MSLIGDRDLSKIKSNVRTTYAFFVCRVCCLYLIPSCTVKVASWGAYLLKRDIIAMSFAPRDTHEAQVQFALERGVPAMIGIMASQRIPYPARAFDMAHCSRCLIPWHKLGIHTSYIMMTNYFHWLSNLIRKQLIKQVVTQVHIYN